MKGGPGKLLEGEIDSAPVELVGAEVLPIGHAIQCPPYLGLLLLRSTHVVLKPATHKVGDQREVVEGGKGGMFLHPRPVIVGTSAVFRRAGMLTADAAWVGPSWIGREDLLEADVKLPAGDEIVVVGEALPQAQPEADQGNRLWVGGEADAGAAASIILAVDPEAVQVDVLPTHRELDDVMEVGNRRVALDEDAAPDQWGHVAQDQPELVDARGGLAHGSAFYATTATVAELPPGL